jgi:hypothetical protein
MGLALSRGKNPNIGVNKSKIIYSKIVNIWFNVYI